jgi:hypothetical protein
LNSRRADQYSQATFFIFMAKQLYSQAIFSQARFGGADKLHAAEINSI